MSPDLGFRLLHVVERDGNCDEARALLRTQAIHSNGIGSGLAGGITGGRRVECSVEVQQNAQAAFGNRDLLPSLALNTAVSMPPTSIPNFSQAKLNLNGVAELSALGDVLDWVGRSELGKDPRFIPQDPFDGGFGRGVAVTNGERQLSARELNFANVQDISKNAKIRPQTSQVNSSANCTQSVGNAGVECSKMMEEDREWRKNLSDEEAEWINRQERTGTVGRLVVYEDDDDPQEDFILRGGYYGHFVVATVRDGGPAARMGVKSGDRLVSINGKKDFVGLSATEVRMRMQAPVMIVFLGFVGKLQAEVRLECSDPACGLSLRHEVARGFSDAPLQISDETIFHAGAASLFLAVMDKMPPLPSSNENVHIFELQQCEANELLHRALSKLPPIGDVSAFASVQKAIGDPGLPDDNGALDLSAR
jgi:hypothetical protein